VCSVSDPDYSLAWPRDLFTWEGARVLRLPDSDVPSAISTLLRESFVDADVERAFEKETSASALSEVWEAEAATAITNSGVAWFRKVLDSADRLHQYEPPVYFAQRQGLAEETETNLRPFADSVVDLIHEMQDLGYFPTVLPRDCVDKSSLDPNGINSKIQRAIRQPVEWPEYRHSGPLQVSNAGLLSLIEYFHDQAQRPRTSWLHGYNECGYHYETFNRESGGVVYRWRMNEVLAAHGSEFRLGRGGRQRGRLVRTLTEPIDAVLENVVAERREKTPTDEIAESIEMFRSRSALMTEKRAALGVIANHLEPRRERIKDAISRKDESDLFNVANNFAIRHRNDHQRSDYGVEYLDWLFVSYLGTIQLVDSLERREGSD